MSTYADSAPFNKTQDQTVTKNFEKLNLEKASPKPGDRRSSTKNKSPRYKNPQKHAGQQSPAKKDIPDHTPTKSQNAIISDLNKQRRRSDKHSIPESVKDTDNEFYHIPEEPSTLANLEQKNSAENSQAFDFQSTFDSKKLYFWGISRESLEEIPVILKQLRASRVNVDPSDGEIFSGDILFKSVEDALRAFSILNGLYKSSKNRQVAFSTSKGTCIDCTCTISLKITQLPEESDIVSLYDFFRVVGPVYELSIQRNAEEVCTGTGYVSYFSDDSAEEAMNELNFGNYKNNLIMLKIGEIEETDSEREQPVSETHETKQNNISNSLKEYNQHDDNTNYESNIPESVVPTISASTIVASPSRIEQPPIEQSKSENKSGSGLGGIIVPGKLFVTNLDMTVSHSELFQLFKPYGYINSARVSIDPLTKKSRGHGIVQMGTAEYAVNAHKALNGVELKGRKLVIHFYEHVSKDLTNSPSQHSVGASSPLSRRVSGNMEQQQTPTKREIHSPVFEEGGVFRGTQAPASPINMLNKAGKLESNNNSPRATPIIERNRDVLEDSGYSTAKSPLSPNRIAKPTTPGSVSNTGGIFDLSIIHGLSKLARTELLAQKLVIEINKNPLLDKTFASEIITYLLSGPLETVIELINSSDVLSEEWRIAQGRFSLNSLDPLTLQIVCDCWDRNKEIEQHSRISTPSKAGEKGGNFTKSIQTVDSDRDPETEKYIEMLLSKPESERKQKLGSRLFPLVKGLGFSNPTKLTVWILENMIGDLRKIAYALNDSIVLQGIVKGAAEKMNGA
ncbi:hypothetical protein BB558_004566 [Smittium angustum]|uniref:RRM domain-containing protein n=1 Tax=Smittium angustum TaxID=133377 RepID=A0A2U1J2X6_SMIAN|nr:hypothetical protein BB558_004566 [Smittium angustum]